MQPFLFKSLQTKILKVKDFVILKPAGLLYLHTHLKIRDMKFFYIAILFVSLTALAQKPEFSGRPYVLQNNVALGNLERVDAQFDAKLKGMGYGGTQLMYTVFSARSTSRFSKNALPKFIIRVESGVDPSEAFTIMRAEVKDGKRSFMSGNYNVMGRAKDNGHLKITANYKKREEGIYEITLPDDIDTGEYGFVPSGGDTSSLGRNAKISCFAIVY